MNTINYFWSWHSWRPSRSRCIFSREISMLKVSTQLPHFSLNVCRIHSRNSFGALFCRNKNFTVTSNSILENSTSSMTWFCQWSGKKKKEKKWQYDPANRHFTLENNTLSSYSDKTLLRFWDMSLTDNFSATFIYFCPNVILFHIKQIYLSCIIRRTIKTMHILPSVLFIQSEISSFNDVKRSSCSSHNLLDIWSTSLSLSSSAMTGIQYITNHVIIES